ncbi:MAG: hypothetical protein ACOX36_01785 [Saccharofermentanales bacterium]|jgi:hypothetical protein
MTDILNKGLPERMRAAVMTRYGDPDVIEIMEVPVSVEPRWIIVE